MFESPPLDKLQEAIASPSHPIGMRMRAAYFLRQAYENFIKNHVDDVSSSSSSSCRDKNYTDVKNDVAIDEIVIKTLSQGLMDRRHGSLLRHEFAYVMGQLRDKRCCPCIEKVLLDTSDCIMVRHECGEALGAIGDESSIPSLENAITLNPDRPEIGETCRLAIDYMRWKINGGQEKDVENQPMVCACMLSPYSSVDPAPPHPKHANMSTGDIGQILRDESLPLFERYRAMFSLRNRGGSESVLELGRALLEDNSSALFRHEVAYVLGQMQHDDSVEALAESLRRNDEHPMVRHESAEALGAIEGRWDDVETILKSFLNDQDDVIRESAIVALDAADYWGHSNLSCEELIVGGGHDNNGGVDDIAEHQETCESVIQSFAKIKSQVV